MDSNTKSYLAVDLGASSGRVMVGRLNGAQIELEEAYRFPTPFVEESGHYRWDLERLEGCIREGVELGLQLAPDAKSVSVDSWSVDFVALDAAGRPTRRPYCYRDARNQGMMDLAFRTVSKERLYEITGIQYLPFNTLFQILADKKFESDRIGEVRNRLLIADYFNYVLGGSAVIDLSMASSTHMVDARTQDWSPDVLEAFGIERGTLPQIVPSGTIIGEAAGRPGLKVIATCSHDTAAAVAAVPAREETDDWAYISSGTWSLIGLELADPLLSMEAMRAGFTNEIGLDGRIRFLKNLSGLWILQECMREWRVAEPDLSWDALGTEAAAAASGEFVIDIDDPRFMAPGDMLRRLEEYCAEKGVLFPSDRGRIARLILESLADAYARATRLMEKVSSRRVKVLHIVGGGSQNELLCRLAANATGCRIEAGPVEATALGNVLVQARTLGDIPDGVSLRDVVRRSFALRTYNPK
ncbi:MAG: rhamnulokinase family protein [Rhodothermales bacterium]